MTPQIQTLIDDLAKDLQPMVQEIEASPKMTQNHYGRYMSLLSSLGKGNKDSTQIIALALMSAGANKAGIASALKILF